jgi:tight adherence protein C
VHLDTAALAVVVLAFAGVSALGLGLVQMNRRGERLARRLAEPVPDAVLTLTQRLQPAEPKRSVVARLLAPIAALAKPSRQDELARLRLRLQQGGIRQERALALFLSSKVVLAFAFAGAFLWANAQRLQSVEQPFLAVVLSFAAGFYLPDWWLRSRRITRQTAIERGLPDGLDLLVTCVEAGLGLDAAIQRVSDEIRRAWPILASELQTTFLEVKAGMQRIEAFRRLASRTGVAELKQLAATLTQTETFGTSVALALRIQAEGIRVRRMQRAEERAAYVSVKMTIPLVLCILPTLLAIVLGPAIVNIAHNLLPALGAK